MVTYCNHLCKLSLQGWYSLLSSFLVVCATILGDTPCSPPQHRSLQRKHVGGVGSLDDKYRIPAPPIPLSSLHQA